MKTSNENKLQLKALVNSGCIYTKINKQLVKEKIKTELINRLFKVFNIDGTKNEEVMRFVPLKLKINKQKTDTVVINLNSTDIFLGYNWLVKYNLEVN